MSTDPQLPPREEKIKRRAYEIWERDGRPDGKHFDHWHEAEQDLLADGPSEPLSIAPAADSSKKHKPSIS
jgi:hypothetical protein